MDYESGEATTQETVELFSELVKTGQAWKLQGSYGRAAAAMIENGLLDREGNINQPMLDELMEGE